MPFADWPVAARNFTPARSACSSCGAGRRAASGGSSPAGPGSPRPDCRHCRRAAATIAPTPSSMAMIDCVCATASCWRSFDRWPPAIWPVSCASTPMISFGVLRSISAPALTKMRRPSMTKALNDSLVDERDLDVLLREAGGLQDRLGVVAHQLLDLGVADERNAARQARRLRGHRRDGKRHAATANAVSSASARVAGVRRRALIGLPSTVILVRDREPRCSAKLVAPPGRVNATRITSGCAFARASGVRTGRMRQHGGKALTRRPNGGGAP